MSTKTLLIKSLNRVSAFSLAQKRTLRDIISNIMDEIPAPSPAPVDTTFTEVSKSGTYEWDMGTITNLSLTATGGSSNGLDFSNVVDGRLYTLVLNTGGTKPWSWRLGTAIYWEGGSDPNVYTLTGPSIFHFVGMPDGSLYNAGYILNLSAV